MKETVHMDVILAEDDDEIFCGIQGFNINVTLDWELVNCKRCLNKNKKASGK